MSTIIDHQRNSGNGLASGQPRPLVIVAAVAGITSFSLLCVMAFGIMMLTRAEPAAATPTPRAPFSGTSNFNAPSPTETPDVTVIHSGGGAGAPQPTTDQVSNEGLSVAGRTFRVTEILAVTQEDCSCGANFKWQEWSIGAELAFDKSGGFLYVPVGIGSLTRDDLYPIRGRYSEGGDSVTFEGSSESVVGPGNTAQATIRGRIWLDAQGDLRVEIADRADAIMAAVVLGQGMSQSLYSVVEYEAKVVAVD